MGVTLPDISRTSTPATTEDGKSTSVTKISTSLTATPTDPIATDTPTALTTIYSTQQITVTGVGGVLSTSTSIATSVVTDPTQASSLSAAAASSSLSRTQTSSSHASSTGTGASTSGKSSSNLSTIIPAVAVPVAVILIASCVAFWFFMRRRQRRDLKDEPPFVMTGKTEKITSTTNSLASDYQDHGRPTERQPTAPVVSQISEKPVPSTRSLDISPRPPNSSSGALPNYSRGHVGVARTSNIREEQRPGPLLPPIRTDSSSLNARHIANFTSNASPTSNYTFEPNRTANPHLGSRIPQSNLNPGPQNISGRGPPAGVGTSNHVLMRNRSQSLTSPRRDASSRSSPYLNNENWGGQSPVQRPPTAPTSGFRGIPSSQNFSSPGQQQSRTFLSIANRGHLPSLSIVPTSSDSGTFLNQPQYSPIVRDPVSSGSGSFVNQPQYSPIIRDAPRARRTNESGSQTQSRGISYGSHHSPLLPSPQPDGRRDDGLTSENLRIARLANSSRLGFGSPTPDNDNISEVSAHDEAEEDVKSDVSSLNELERFDFERDTRESRRSGSAINNNSPNVAIGHERPWR